MKTIANLVGAAIVLIVPFTVLYIIRTFAL